MCLFKVSIVILCLYISLIVSSISEYLLCNSLVDCFIFYTLHFPLMLCYIIRQSFIWVLGQPISITRFNTFLFMESDSSVSAIEKLKNHLNLGNFPLITVAVVLVSYHTRRSIQQRKT